ncbi:MAG: HD domain-containing protein [Acidobacteria bacterium]|nr:HD domain-containing protein [Acidobacteriota bacterium]
MFDSVESVKNLLLIDDKPADSSSLFQLLRSNYRCDFVSSVEAAKSKVRNSEYSVILCNANVEDALEKIPHFLCFAPHTAIILMSEDECAEKALQAFRAGAFDFLLGPKKLEEVEKAILRGIEHFETRCLKDKYQVHLEILAAERAIEIDKALEEVESSYRITLKALVQALETRDFETHGHSERVVTFSLRLGHELGLENERLRDLELGALLHDIGKIGVPDAILRKPAKLNEDEWAKMKLHPVHGQKILRNIRFLEGAARVVGQHHERWDGAGYPYGIRGEDIDIGARIFAVVDAFDAMVSDRVYRKGRPYEAALEELERCAGTQFDPLIVEAFKSIPQEDWEILRERSLMDKQEVHSFQSVVADLVYSREPVEMVH